MNPHRREVAEIRGKPEAERLVISGTGRAGTTFLVRVLTYLGFDTGYQDAEDGYDPNVRAGMETHPRPGMTPEQIGSLPYVVKDPQLCLFLPAVLDTTAFRVRRLIIPVRDLGEASASRVQRGRFGAPRSLLWLSERGRPEVFLPQGVPRAGEALLALQRSKLAEFLGEIVATAVTRGIRYVLIPSDVIFNQPSRLFILLEEDLPGTSMAEFLVAHARISEMQREGR